MSIMPVKDIGWGGDPESLWIAANFTTTMTALRYESVGMKALSSTRVRVALSLDVSGGLGSGLSLECDQGCRSAACSNACLILESSQRLSPRRELWQSLSLCHNPQTASSANDSRFLQ